MLSRSRSAALLGLLVGTFGVLASLVPFAARVEEDGGLHWLFALRGARSPPANVLVVSIDRPSAEALGLSADPARWPRSLHGRLVRSLTAAGARVIVFDVFFGEPGPPAEDSELAAAMREADNVVLTARISQRAVPLDSGIPTGTAEAVSFQMLAPAEPLRGSALAVAPFSLPAWPMKVSQFWVFHEAAGDRPTLPTAAIQAYAKPFLGEFQRLLGEAGILDQSWDAAAEGDLGAFMQATRDRFLAQPERAQALLQQFRVAPRTPPDDRWLMLRDLVGLYAGPSSHFLNYYGPPLTIPTIPYQDVVNGAPLRAVDGSVPDLRGSIVFVGFAARAQPDQRDSFFSAFSQETGLNLSGVEIAATATANLLEDRPLRPLPAPVALAVLFIWGGYLGFVCRLLPGAPGIAAGAVSATLYLLGALYAFSTADVWAPVMVPVFLQTPLAVLGALLLQFRQARDQRERIGAAMGRYVTPALVERLVAEGTETATAAELVYGTCMATDASQYTLMAETLAPDDLGRLMNAYYDVLFAEVERHGGLVSDVVGDAMMAIWASARREAGSRLPSQACAAALSIIAELDRRAACGEREALPTRIGLHSGEIQLGSLGARQHLEYRAVGDIVNTATRIEGLNKYLGTRVLVSAETLKDLGGFMTRDVGTFLLAGKTIPVVVHELLGPADDRIDERIVPGELFGAALAAFRKQSWPEAARLFRKCLEHCAFDGPARFYAGLCDEYLANGPVTFSNGAVRVSGK